MSGRHRAAGSAAGAEWAVDRDLMQELEIIGSGMQECTAESVLSVGPEVRLIRTP